MSFALFMVVSVGLLILSIWDDIDKNELKRVEE